ncbi:MAG: metallophosphoesterase, partial [Verrucomicrobia bacterium]|nr:metallophosphoesterase [Verrucomicrobiota bacterium]
MVCPRIVLLLGLCLVACPAHSDAVALIGVGDPWRFQAASEAAGEAWRQTDFDDAAWRMGDSGFGLSTWGENTLFQGMLRGPGALQFRRTFVIEDPASVRSLTFRCDWQGGFVAWLNGVEVLRRNLPGVPGTPLPLDTPASYRRAGAAEEFLISDPRLRLQSGTNILAIQCHPYAVGWYDVVLVPELLANFSRGPYLQRVLQDQATVLWSTPEAMPGVVEYGEGPALTEVAAPVAGPSTASEAVLRGLKPGTRYRYRVRSGSGDAAVVSPTATFRTLPASGDLDFAVLGDSGAGTAGQFGVARRMAESAPDLVLHLGDIVYPDFSAGRTDTRLLSVYRPILSTTPFYFAWGNHDLYGGTAAYLAALRPPTNSTSLEDHRAEGTLPEFYYSFDAGDAHFAVLYWPYSSQYAMRPECPQLRWLEQDLARSDKPWKFLTLHHPVNTSGGHRFDDYNRNGILDRMEVADRLLPVARRHGVQMIFSGHDHN